MRRIFALIAAVIVVSLSSSAQTIKVACIGDSITYGYGIENRDSCSYPAQLQFLLGSTYDVRNFGHGGATLIRKSFRPYNTLPEYQAALEFASDMVIINLGINDTDPRSWPNYSEEFIPDYHALMDDFKKINPKVKIWICLMTPISHTHKRFLSGTRDWHLQEQNAIRQIAETTPGVGLIDLYSPLFVRPDLFPDGLHPDAEGAGIIAKCVFGALTGDFGGLKLSPMYSDNMVLQRQKPILLEGTADAGTRINVILSDDKSKIARGNATAAPDGKWSVTLPALEAGGPYELKIGERLFENVWIGEVWLCSGQSNMEFKLKDCNTADEDVRGADGQDKIHLFHFVQKYGTPDEEWSAEFCEDANHLGYFNTFGWKMCNSKDAAEFSAIAYHFGRVLADSLGCHVGLINNAVGGSPIESWCNTEMLRWEYPQILNDWYHGDFGQEWARGRALKNLGSKANLKLQRHAYSPGYLFDVAIRPMGHYPLRGIIWYQGEANAHYLEGHEDLFRLALKSWREWFAEDLNIQMIQLSGFDSPSWPAFRNSQRIIAQETDNVEMTVCSDLGHPTDIHPKDKKPVGERAAWSALHYVYGRDNVIPSGPVFKKMQVEGNAIRLHFDFAEGLCGDSGFEIAAADGIYHLAEAKIEHRRGEAPTVVVRSREVTVPASVRYAWKPFPENANLYNGAGMPCSTFKASISPITR